MKVLVNINGDDVMISPSNIKIDDMSLLDWLNKLKEIDKKFNKYIVIQEERYSKLEKLVHKL